MKLGRVMPETWAQSLKKCWFFVELRIVFDTVMVGQEVQPRTDTVTCSEWKHEALQGTNCLTFHINQIACLHLVGQVATEETQKPD